LENNTITIKFGLFVLQHHLNKINEKIEKM